MTDSCELSEMAVTIEPATYPALAGKLDRAKSAELNRFKVALIEVKDVHGPEFFGPARESFWESARLGP